MVLYETTAQVVPVLMIALFLDTRTAAPASGRSARSSRFQNRLYILLCVAAFVVSLLILADIVPEGRITQALVIAALIGCIILMAAPAWRRSRSAPRNGTAS